MVIGVKLAVEPGVTVAGDWAGTVIVLILADATPTPTNVADVAPMTNAGEGQSVVGATSDPSFRFPVRSSSSR